VARPNAMTYVNLARCGLDDFLHHGWFALQWLTKEIRFAMFKLLSLSLWLLGDSHITP